MTAPVGPRPPPQWGRAELAWALLAPPVRALTAACFDVRAAGLSHVPRRGPCLLVANHTDHLDPIVMLAAMDRWRGRRTRFLALDDLFDLPLTGWWLRRARAIPVARGAGVAPMISGVRSALDAGELVVVYPEGRLPRQPGARPTARRGVGALARALPDTVPIVPVAHRGLEPPSKREPHPALRLAGRGLGHPVGLAAGAPLQASDLAGGDDAAAAAALLGVIRSRLAPVADDLATGGLAR